MNKHDFINQTLSTLNSIEYNVSKTGFLMGDDALKLIKLCENTIKQYHLYTAPSGITEEYIKELSDKEFQSLLYKMCKTKYPELNELWFRIDERETQIEVKYKNNTKEEV